jgi:calcineurin-like phosphoesterase family protein
MNFDARKNNIKSMQSYLLKMSKSFNYEKDIVVIKNLLKKSYDYYEKEMQNNPDLKEEYYNYRKWIDTDLKDEIKDRLDDIREAAEYEELMEKFEIDKFLVWFDKPLQKLKGGKIKVYHGSSILIEKEYIDPISFNVGATKFSEPRWSTYFWDNREDAMCWASTWEVSNHHKYTIYIGHNGKTLLGKPDGVDDKTFVKDLIEKMSNSKFYIYECEIDIRDLEIGSAPSIKEYTVSKPVKILKRFEYKLNKEIVRRCFEILPVDEVIKFKEKNKGVKHLNLHRNFILNNILDNTRDSYRAIMRTDLQQGNINIGDDLSDYKYSINRHVKNDTYNLREEYIHESSISIAHINKCLQQDTDRLLKQYLQDYTDFYHRMMKEQPASIPHINEDIKKAILAIDDLSKKENVNNDLLKSAKWCLGDLVNLNKNTKPIKHSNHTQSLMGMSINTEAFNPVPNGNIWVGADWHFYTKYNDKLKENPNIDKIIRNFNRKIKKNDIVIFVGDLYDARRIYDKKEMPKLDHIKKLNGHKIFVKGNHDVDPDQAYYDLGFDLVCMRHEIGNLVFTHEPVAVNENQINIHGHLHYCRDYWYIKPTSHIDVYTARFNYQPINVKEAVLKYNDGIIKPLAVNTFNELFGITAINESSDIEAINNSILKIKMLCNPESRNIFTLNDKSSQIIINEHYVIQRDMKGTNCSITQGQCDETNKKILEFDVVFNENLNIDVLIKEKIESGVQISSLFNPDDIENRFIREMSMKLFGLYPDRCEMYR